MLAAQLCIGFDGGAVAAGLLAAGTMQETDAAAAAGEVQGCAGGGWRCQVGHMCCRHTCQVC